MHEELITNEQIAQWRELADAASFADWQVGHTATETHEAAAAFMAESIAKSDKTDLWMVCFGERDENNVINEAITVAYTGNGPTSEANAYYLAACKPQNIYNVLSALLRARSEIARLTYLLEKQNKRSDL